MQRLPRSETLCTLALVALYAAFVACGWMGLDLGRHWDENFNVLRRVGYSIQHRTLLPGWYELPSFLHGATLAALVPDAALETLRGNPDVAGTLITTVDSHAFLLRMRAICCALAALTIVWLFLLVRQRGGGGLEALIAASVAAGSWELQYHSRWITADAVVAQFGALTLLLTLTGHGKRSSTLLGFAGAAAGLACGAKYPAGALIVPVFVACALLPARRLQAAARAAGLAAAAFVITTPGILVEPVKLVLDLRYQIGIYTDPTFVYGPYLVRTPFEHALRAGQYLVLVLASHYAVLSVAVSLAATAGLVALLRAERGVALIVISFPLVYLGYFVTRHMMIARNLLVILPFIAFLAARGMAQLLGMLRTRSMLTIAAAGLAMLALANLAWLYAAARSIQVRDGRVFVRQLSDYLAANPHQHFAISPGVRSALASVGGTAPREWPLASDVQNVVFFARDVPLTAIPANRWNGTVTWFGPYEVNFDYYPTWRANDRIVVMSRQQIMRR